MTVLPINVGEMHGGRIETDSGGLLNLVSNSGVKQYTFSWSTNFSAFECFDRLDRSQLLKPFASQEFLSFAIGVENLNGEWATDFKRKSKPPYEDLFRSVLLRVPEENQVCARCELPGIAWVWLVNSPLQSGSKVKTFGVITEFLDENFVAAAFDLTASNDSHPLRGRLVAFANAAPDPEKIAEALKGLGKMRCKGQTKITPVEHSVALSTSDCMLRDGQNGTLDHSFTSKSTDPWTGRVTVKEVQEGQGIFFHGEKVDTFSVNPVIATDYVLGIILKKATQPPVQRDVEFRASERDVLGDGAGVEVTDVWTLGTRQERGVFSVPFKVGR